MSSREPRLTIFFTVHLESYPEPLLRTEFQANFLACDVFIVEMAEQWQLERPDLESHYNRLSEGEIEDIPDPPRGELEEQLDEALGPPRRDFTNQLRATIRGSKKKIVLERPPVPFLEVSRFNGELATALMHEGLDRAVALCKDQQQQVAASMVERDKALVDLIVDQMASGARPFTFRGSGHEARLRKLLDERKVAATIVRFAEPTLLERIVSPLTVGETSNEADVLRHLYTVLNLRKDSYEELMALEKEAEGMSEDEVRHYLGRFGPRIHV